MNEHVNDTYVKQAKMYNYRSRAAFKLMEINQRYNILRPGYKVIDLGAAPGGWAQVAVDKVNSTKDNPSVVCLDRNPMAEVPGAYFIKGDIEDDINRMKLKEFFNYENVDVVMSDMAPNFEGDKDTDHMGISVLNALTLKVCFNNLRTGGTVIMKTLHGTMENAFFTFYKGFFKDFHRIKPSASRSRSSEIFYLGTGFKLNENYQKFLKVAEKMKNNQPIDKSEYPNYGMDLEALKRTYEEIISKGQEIGISMSDEMKKELENLGVDIDINSENKDKLKDASPEKLIDDLFASNPSMQFSFNRKVPSSLKELIEMQGDTRQEFEDLMKGKKKGKESTLFEPEEEKMEYEKMDTLADIDDLPADQFEDERKEEEHVMQMRREEKAELRRQRDMTTNFVDKYAEASKDPASFEALLNEEPGEVLRTMNLEDDYNQARTEAEELEKYFHFSQEKEAKAKSQIMREKKSRSKDFFKKNRDLDEFWDRK